MAGLRDIVVDCSRAAPLARFWAAALDGYDVRPYDEAEIARLAGLGYTPDTDPTVAVDGPGPTLFFQEVPEPKPAKNRLHLDLSAPDRRAETERLVALGASVFKEYESHTTLLDPEGNEFCVLD
jgi:Glyoxalase-like domain